MNKYPILSPYIHYNELNNSLGVLTNIKTLKTKSLKEYQKKIIKECNGLLTVEQIIEKFRSEGMSESILSQIKGYIDKMILWGYLIWSPTQNYLVTNAGIMRESTETNHTNLIPNGLNTITISILDSCCLQCSYCSQCAKREKSDVLSLELISKMLQEAYDLGARYFGVFGGEPMMHPQIFEIIQTAYQLGYSMVYLFTRATLITHEKAKKLHSVGISELQLTVDSHIPQKYDAIVGVQGSFNKMFQGLYYLQDVGINIILKIIVTSYNIDDVMDTILFFKDAGVTIFSLEVVYPVGRADYNALPSNEKVIMLKRNIDILLQHEKNIECNLTYLTYGKPKQCGGGINSIFVFSDGETGPCDKSHFIRNEISFGNIHEKSLKEIWKSKEIEPFRKLRNNDQRCAECKLSNTCLGGCILNSYVQLGKVGPDSMCSRISGIEGGIYPAL